MTSRIYIRGDVGIPSSLQVFDADTGKQLVVHELAINVYPMYVNATMMALIGGDPRLLKRVDAEVVPAPSETFPRHVRFLYQANKGAPASSPAAPPAPPICDECGGTGEVVLLNGPVPCSRGCKP